jgi:stringent starvation protein B
MSEMTSSRPYLIRAIYEWIVDNHCTPHLLVNATGEQVVVPRQFVKDGRLILNISPSAVRGLVIGNDAIVFGARFGGMTMELFVPTSAVLGIYAQEDNGQGMFFPEEDFQAQGSTEEPEPDPPVSPGGGRPKLSIVK